MVKINEMFAGSQCRCGGSFVKRIDESELFDRGGVNAFIQVSDAAMHQCGQLQLDSAASSERP